MSEKSLPIIVSVLALVIVLGYVRYSNNRIKELMSEHEQAQRMHDGTLAPADYGTTMPFPAISYDLPLDLKFAGESIPLDIPDVHERLDKELQINIYLHSSTIFLIKRANRWLPQMQ